MEATPTRSERQISPGDSSASDASLAPGSQAIALTTHPTTTNAQRPAADSRKTFDAHGNILEVDDGGIFAAQIQAGSANWSA